MTNIFWPETDDLWSAKKACVQGASVALLVGVVTGIVTFMSLRGSPLLPGIGTAGFIDAALFLVLSFFIYRCSRIASVATLLLYVYGQAMLFQQTHRNPTSAIVFGLFLIGGIRGAFAFHELKNSLSAGEVQTALKKQREETGPQPSLTKRVVAWTILIVLASGGYWWYRSSTHRPEPHISVTSSKPLVLPQIKVAPVRVSASMPGPQAQDVSAQVQAPFPAPSSPGKRVFKLKDGRTVSGRVITDDLVYYTVETFGGKQELVIKEDVVS